MSAYRTAPGVAPVRIPTYPKRRPNHLRDARIEEKTRAREIAPAPVPLRLDLSYKEFLLLTNEQASVSA